MLTAAPVSTLNAVTSVKQTGQVGGGGPPNGSAGGSGSDSPHIMEAVLSSSADIRDVAWLSEDELIVVGSYSENTTIGDQTLTAAVGGVDDLFIMRLSLSQGVLWLRTAECDGIDRFDAVSIAADGTIWATGVYEEMITIDQQTFGEVASGMHVLVARLDGNGTALGQSHSTAGDASADRVESNDISVLGNDTTIVGSTHHGARFGSFVVDSPGTTSVGFVARLTPSGEWDSLTTTTCCGAGGAGTSNAMFRGIEMTPDGDLLVVGGLDEGVEFDGSVIVPHAGVREADGVIMRLTSDHELLWSTHIGSEENSGFGTEVVEDLLSRGSEVSIIGTVEGSKTNRVMAGSVTPVQTRGGSDAVTGVLNASNGDWRMVRAFGGQGDETGGRVTSLADNITLYSIGYDAPFTLAGTLFSNSGAPGVALIAISGERGSELWVAEASASAISSHAGALASNQTYSVVVGNRLDSDGYSLMVFDPDADGDGVSSRTDDFPDDASQQTDSDGDGWGDSSEGRDPDGCPTQWGNSTLDRWGCPDADGDGVSNQFDRLPDDPTQYLDSDHDGYGDDPSGNQPDACPLQMGESESDVFGCPDGDGDGWSNEGDMFDAEPSQWLDSDSDGYGDNLLGFEGDACPLEAGNSTADRYGCTDSDGDSFSDRGDDFIDDAAAASDIDGDGWPDELFSGHDSLLGGEVVDVFPLDASQWEDSDGDDHGDNPFGTLGDHFADDVSQWSDMDLDGHGDDPSGTSPDAFTYNPTQWVDSDGDGWGDNQTGLQADRFPTDPSQWSDIDGDGCGDNPNGTDADAFPHDSTQCVDSDGDGWGDDRFGNRADLFPNDPTQWQDEDGDGLGDNQSGSNADPYLFDFDNDGYNDSIDPLPRLASPGDLDNDGCLDAVDAFPANDAECEDHDGDGIGDNQDLDDDGDGWLDSEELRLGTDSFSAADMPLESFEIMLPFGIGLSAWDLFGILIGAPTATWIGYGLATRHGRGERYAQELRDCPDLQTLETVSQNYEEALRYRLLGPHQGLMLERIRSNIENDIQEALFGLAAESTTAMGPPEDASGVEDDDGWEWLEWRGGDWYRTDASEQWQEWLSERPGDQTVDEQI